MIAKQCPQSGFFEIQDNKYSDLVTMDYEVTAEQTSPRLRLAMTSYHSHDIISPLIGGDVRRTEGVENKVPQSYLHKPAPHEGSKVFRHREAEPS